MRHQNIKRSDVPDGFPERLTAREVELTGDDAEVVIQAFGGGAKIRLRIWSALDHPTSAKEIEAEHPDVGRATIYRILKDFELVGLIAEVDPIPADRAEDDKRHTRTYYRRLHDQLLLFSAGGEPGVALSRRSRYNAAERLAEENHNV